MIKPLISRTFFLAIIFKIIFSTRINPPDILRNVLSNHKYDYITLNFLYFSCRCMSYKCIFQNIKKYIYSKNFHVAQCLIILSEIF